MVMDWIPHWNSTRLLRKQQIVLGGLLSCRTWRRVASTAVDSVQPATSDSRIGLWVDEQNARRERRRELIAHDTVTFVVTHLSPYTRIKSNRIIFINIEQQIKSTEVKKERTKMNNIRILKGDVGHEWLWHLPTLLHSVWYELTEMSWNSRINSLAVIYLWVRVNSP